MVYLWVLNNVGDCFYRYREFSIHLFSILVMSKIKKTIYKLLLLAGLFVLLNLIYTKFFYENDLQEHSEIINKIREIDPAAEIVYFGESSNTSFPPTDSDQRSISQMCADYFPNVTFEHVTKEAPHGII